MFFFDRKYDEQFVFANNVIPVVVSPQARHPWLWYTWFEITLPYYLKKYKVDHFLSTDGYLSLKANVPQTVVLHDLAFEHYPEYINKRVAKYYQKFTPLYAQKAENVIAVSEFTKTDIVQRYSVSKNKIRVVYNGYEDKEQQFEIVEGLPDKYFLFVGALHPRKNLNNILKAFDQFKADDHDDIKLLIVGREAWGNNEMKAIYDNMKYKSDVVFMGRLSDQQLAYVYSKGLALVYVSLFEGFGIPIIEAQSYNIPVITSKTSSMPEVAGEGAVLVNPKNPESIANGMSLLGHDKDLRDEYIRRGSRNLTRFSWDYAAKKVLDVILKR